MNMVSSPAKPFRVIATGLRGGRANIAFDQALIEARSEGKIPDTIRFLRFRPSALIGIHQFLSHEIKLDYCRAHGIETVRRITGGGGLYFDEGQIGWELVFDRATLGIDRPCRSTRRICEAAALGLQKLGVPARYRPRNDIEVDGRKISGTGGFFEGNLIFYQGTLLIDFDPAKMLACLKVPAEKLAKRGIDSAAQRIITHARSAGRRVTRSRNHLSGPGRRALPKASASPRNGDRSRRTRKNWPSAHSAKRSAPTLTSQCSTRRRLTILVSASLTGRGGTVRADIRLEGVHRDRIREVLITGDFFITPPRVVFDLEASLRDLNVADAGRAVESFFARTAGRFSQLERRRLSPGDRDGAATAWRDGGRQLTVRRQLIERDYG